MLASAAPRGHGMEVDDRLLFALALGGLHSGTFFGVWGLFAWMFRRGLLRRYQAAQGREPPAALLRRAVREPLFGHPLFALLCYLAVYPLWRWAGGRMHGPLPGPTEVAGHLLLFIVINDTVFYWTHRLLHVPLLFKRIHVRHHRFRFVRGPSAEFAHPIENIGNFIAFFAGPCLLGGHVATLYLWVAVRMFETVEAHSGYALTGSSSRHAYHHLYAQRGCYGSFFGLWDFLMGTDRRWRAWKRGQAR